MNNIIHTNEQLEQLSKQYRLVLDLSDLNRMFNDVELSTLIEKKTSMIEKELALYNTLINTPVITDRSKNRAKGVIKDICHFASNSVVVKVEYSDREYSNYTLRSLTKQ